MSYVSNEYTQCERIQDALEAHFVTCTTPQENMPGLEIVMESTRMSGVSQEVVDGNGKVKTIRLTYEQRLLESAATEGSGARSCTTTNQTYNNFQDYTIDPNVFVTASERFTIADMATVCQDTTVFFAKKIAKVVDVIERKIATKSMDELAALAGKWGDNVTVNGSDQLVVSTFIDESDKKVDPTTWAEIDLAIRKTGFCNTPVIIGGSDMYQYFRYSEAGCCALSGIDLATTFAQHGKAALYDKRLATALGGDDESLVVQMGSVALLTYNEFDAKRLNGVALVGADYNKMVVYGPRTGLPIDIILKDDCGTINIVGYANTKVVALPSDMFAVGDEYEGVNFITKILVDNPA